MRAAVHKLVRWLGKAQADRQDGDEYNGLNECIYCTT
jgi:hypothetical protein